MIIVCERCRTRFQVDDARIPAGGVNLRCSRCKHSFFLDPSAPFREPEADQSPEQSEHAPGAARSDPPRRGEESGPLAFAELDPPRAVGAASDEGESDWEFNTDLPGPDEAAEPGSSHGHAAELEEALGGLSLDDVGDPGSWDLLGEESEEPAAGSESDPGRDAPESRPAPAPARESSASAPARQVAPHAPAAPRHAAAGRRAVEGLGWAATLVLLVLAGHGGLSVSARRSEPSLDPRLVAGLALEEVHARRVENALGGLLYVVSGRLRNPGSSALAPGSLIMVSLLREDGSRIAGGRAPAGLALPLSRLREADPDALRAEQARRARTLALHRLGAGSAVGFDAVFDRLPPGAARMLIEEVPLPALDGELAPEPTAEPPLAAAPADAATASASLPAALPSSD